MMRDSSIRVQSVPGLLKGISAASPADLPPRPVGGRELGDSIATPKGGTASKEAMKKVPGSMEILRTAPVCQPDIHSFPRGAFRAKS